MKEFIFDVRENFIAFCRGVQNSFRSNFLALPEVGYDPEQNNKTEEWLSKVRSVSKSSAASQQDIL
tara:strand:- start:1459 stop:1656 length:198 start_codon:yes stop_codon:yes gene_type:complete